MFHKRAEQLYSLGLLDTCNNIDRELYDIVIRVIEHQCNNIKPLYAYLLEYFNRHIAKRRVLYPEHGTNSLCHPRAANGDQRVEGGFFDTRVLVAQYAYKIRYMPVVSRIRNGITGIPSHIRVLVPQHVFYS